MQLVPRYGSDPVLSLDGTPSAILEPTIRQRCRLADALESFTEDQWEHPSRCAGWSSRDVIVHLDSTNGFWAFAVAAGLRGDPTRFLSTFDPVSSPAQLVSDAGELSSADVFERFRASTDAFIDTLSKVGDDGWTLPAEAPPGHISISAVVHHALWDSWVHERDILLPLGIPADEEPDEIAACLRYGAGLGPALALGRGDARRGVLAIDVTDPDLTAVVEIGDRVHVREGRSEADLRLTGRAVELLEALSIRAPFGQPVPADVRWMLDGLAVTFDVAPD